MKPFYKYIVLLLISSLVTNCNKEIILKTEFEPQLFIFGNLTNLTKNLKITIQKSIPPEDYTSTPPAVSNAKISLYTERQVGEQILVTNNFSEQNGFYLSDGLPTLLVGNFYWIEIELDGVIYVSEKERLGSVVVIDEITRVNNFIRAIFKDPVDDKNFYRLEITTTTNGKNESSYQITDDVFFNGNKNAFIEDVDGLTGNTIHAKLMSFNYNTYQFYSNVILQEESQSTGGGNLQLFESPPVYLTGNITNTMTKRKVLGNFGVISIDIKDENLTN